MKNKEQVLKELLFELDDICRDNDIRYSLVGIEAAHLIEKNAFPNTFNSLTVAMTIGDVERLLKIVENKESLKVEYYLNNDRARNFGIRLYNNETLYVDVRDFRNHTMYGEFIEILEIAKVPSGQNRKKAALINKICRGANINNYSFRNIKNIVLSVLIRTIQTIIGKNRFKNVVYGLNRKYTGIDSWGMIAKQKKVRVGEKTYKALDPSEAENIAVEDKNATVLRALADEDVKSYNNDQYYEKYVIRDGEHAYRTVLTESMFDDMKAIAKKIDTHTVKQRSSAEAKKNIKNAWDTYLMSREMVENRRRENFDKEV